MSKITNGGLTRSGSGTGCSIVSCTHMAIVGVKGLYSSADVAPDLVSKYVSK